MKSRMPIFTPKYPGFQKYGRQDLQAQAYIQYLPKVFSHEKYVAIWTTPHGRKCPLSFLGRFRTLHPKIKLNEQKHNFTFWMKYTSFVNSYKAL